MKKIFYLIPVLLLSGCLFEGKGQTTINANGVVSTIYPNEAEYISYDNGETWFVDNELTEKPLIFIVQNDNNEYHIGSKVDFIVYNMSNENFFHDVDTNLYYHDNGKWIYNPHKYFSLGLQDMIKVIS